MPKIKNIKLEVTIIFTKEDKYIVAYCPALDLSGYGYTESEANVSFGKNLDIFFEETVEKGTLDKVLLNLGWTIKKKPVAYFEPPSLDAAILSKFSNSKGLTFKQEVVPIPIAN